MATEILSQTELQEIFNEELTSRAPDLTDLEEGSISDAIGGATTVAINEAMGLMIDRFKATFFSTAQGPDENGGGFDELQYLATDHFGNTFKRPAASKAVGVVTFSRPTNAFGVVTILAGTVVSTSADAGGTIQQFKTLATVTLNNLTVNASVEALVAGSDGNAQVGDVKNIETSLVDSSIIVTNSTVFSGGAPEMDSPTYRQFIADKIEAIKGATVAAIEAVARTVSGVVTATVVEVEKVVIQWDIGSSSTVGDYFRIPYPVIYVADANGTANQALLDLVFAAMEPVRACGVYIKPLGASAFLTNWTAEITLNPSGPNYAQLSVSPAEILSTMRSYINAILIGSGFDVSDANAAIMAIWGPSGTNDLSDFQTITPSGNIAGSAGVKLIAGTMAIGSC